MIPVAVLILACAQPPEAASRAEVGSKEFTESVVLGEVAALLARHEGYEVRHRTLGGTRVVWNALVNGEIDVYPEYTGTLDSEIFPQQDLSEAAALRQALAELGIGMTEPLGFNNTYAIGMQREIAERLGIQRISDLRRFPRLKFAVGNEFFERAEGWNALRQTYRLPHRSVRVMDHMLCYRALVLNEIQAMDIYSTDAEVQFFDLRVLEDDLGHFPEYDAVYLYRMDLAVAKPDWLEALSLVSGTLDEARMTALNAKVQVGRKSEQRAAAEFLGQTMDIHVEVDEPGMAERVATYTLEHLVLVAISLVAAIAVAVPLGIVAAQSKSWETPILAVTEIVQTIPGLALLVLLMPVLLGMGLPSVGAPPVIVALFLYSLLPIVRNTLAGIQDIPPALRESALALGMTTGARLRLVEIPMAMPTILAGIKTTAVINVGYATLGGLIGAGGYGRPIMAGLRLADNAIMLEGAIPAAVLAILVKYSLEFVQRCLVPRGLR